MKEAMMSFHGQEPQKINLHIITDYFVHCYPPF